jgi:putative CocE/NonD family hydrolase
VIEVPRIIIVAGLLAAFMLGEASLSAEATTPVPSGARLNDIPAVFEPRAQDEDFTRIEAMVPMRDGVKLYTVVLVPKRGAASPIILSRTPYNAAKRARRIASPRLASTLTYGDEFLVLAGYIRAFQDVRGKDKSEGEYVMTRPQRGPLNPTTTDHSTDTWDTIDWLVKNVPNNNGSVGMIGVSYEGYLALIGMLDPHPALKVVVPINPMVDGWKGDDWFHNGAFRQFNLDYIYRQTSGARSEIYPAYGFYDQYSFFLSAGSSAAAGRIVGADQLPFWKLLIEHPAYDSFWELQAVDTLLRKRSGNVKSLVVHSLFDQEDIHGAISAYRALESGDLGNDMSFLVLGPWSHGQSMRTGSALGALEWDSDTAKYFRQRVLQPFLDRNLVGASAGGEPPPVLAFDTGTREWMGYTSWPQSCAVTCAHRATSLYLAPGSSLKFAAADAGAPYEEYVSDPSKPVPFRVRPIRPIYGEGSTWNSWLADDQRPFSDRTDVLTYVSDVLSEPLQISGSPVARLTASTSGTDADWVVKLIDVFPDEVAAGTQLGGFQFMVAGEILRGRYRESFSKPAPIAPQEPLAYRVEMPAVNHTFLPGHRVMVQIQSSWFPLYDRNPQQFVDNVFLAQPGDYRKATQRIYHTGRRASFIELPVVRRDSQPPRSLN